MLSQQQNYSLEALAKRDAKDDPFKTASPSTPAGEVAPDDEGDDPEANAAASEDVERALRDLREFNVRHGLNVVIPEYAVGA